MRKVLVFALFAGLSVAASRVVAQDTPLGVIHVSDPAGPASERSSHEYDCGKSYGGNVVSLAYVNRGSTAELTRLTVDGRDYTKDVNAQIDVRDSFLQDPYMLCTDSGVDVYVHAYDHKSHLLRTVEITVSGKVPGLDVRELIDSDGMIENGDDAFKHDCDVLRRGVPDTASSTLWANPKFRQTFNQALPHPDTVLRSAADGAGDDVATRSGRFLAGVVSRSDALTLRAYSPDVGRYLSKMGAPSALMIAASCGYGKGVSLLLDAGADVNAGKNEDAGAFNIALLRGDNMLMQDILRHGYHLDDGRRCKSSKYILAHSKHPIVPRVARAIEEATCTSD